MSSLKKVSYESAHAERVDQHVLKLENVKREIVASSSSRNACSTRSRQHPVIDIKSPNTSSPFVHTTVHTSLTVPQSIKSEYGGRDSTRSMMYVDSDCERPLSRTGAESYVLTSQRSSKCEMQRGGTTDTEKELIMSASFRARRQCRQSELRLGINNSPGPGLEMEFVVNLVKQLVDCDS
jgi:hypothetical protein